MSTPKKDCIDKIFEIEYLEIPIVKETIADEEYVEIKFNRSQGLQGTILMLVLVTIVIYAYFIDASIIKHYPIGTFIFAASVLAGLVMFLVETVRRRVIIRLTVDTFEYEGKKISWKDIRRMYVKKQHVNDGPKYELIIEDKKRKKTNHSLEWLEKDYKATVHAIGRYYGNYLVKQDKFNH